MGVRGVIAAGWAVDDAAAQTFATEFYKALFAGQPFGKAVQQARRVTYENHPGVNTWGAYQCYGDHDFTIVQDRSPGVDRGRPKYSAAAELLADLENDAEDASTASKAKAEQLRKHLEQIVKEIPQNWLQSGAVRAALGRAFGEIDCFEEAINHYKAGIAAEKAQYPVRAIEQLANLQTRWAAQSKVRGAARLIQEARQRLLLLNKLAATAERMSLLGSASKRLAVIERNTTRKKKALQDMSKYYRQAQEISLQRTGKSDPYCHLNWLVAQVLLHSVDLRNPLPGDLQKQLEEIERNAAEQNASEPNFWSEVARAECLLARHLASGNLDKNQAEIVEQYQLAQKRGASSREFRSILEHLEFLSNILESSSKKLRRRAAQIKALKSIHDRLGVGES
jgi:CHAT domain-containing protein